MNTTRPSLAIGATLLTLTALSACNSSSKNSSSGSSTPTKATSSSAAAVDSSTLIPLLLTADDLGPDYAASGTPSDVSHSGLSGIAAGFANSSGSIQVGITLVKAGSAADAKTLVGLTEKAAATAVTGGDAPVTLDTGDESQFVTGTDSTDTGKTNTTAVFSEGTYVVTMTYLASDAADAVAQETAAAYAQKQDAKLKG